MITLPSGDPSRLPYARLHSERGLALAELLVSALVLAIAIVGISTMFGWQMAYMQGQGDNRVALFLAQQKLEQLRNIGFPCLPVPDPPTNPCGVTVEHSELLDAGIGGSHFYRRLTEITLSADTHTKQITVTVTPATPGGDDIVSGPRAGDVVSLTTLLSRH